MLDILMHFVFQQLQFEKLKLNKISIVSVTFL